MVEACGVEAAESDRGGGGEERVCFVDSDQTVPKHENMLQNVPVLSHESRYALR